MVLILKGRHVAIRYIAKMFAHIGNITIFISMSTCRKEGSRA
jgi:hypothetical protein